MAWHPLPPTFFFYLYPKKSTCQVLPADADRPSEKNPVSTTVCYEILRDAFVWYFSYETEKNMLFPQMCYIRPSVRYRWLRAEMVSQAFSRRRRTALLQRVEIVRRE